MLNKTVVAYAPFNFHLTAMMQNTPVYENTAGKLRVFKNEYDAYEQWDILKNTPGQPISTFGCGPDESQHVQLPTCSGILKLNIPEELLNQETQEMAIQERWIQQVDIRIEGDIIHHPILYTEITNGLPLDYGHLPKIAQSHFDDLVRICSKLVVDSEHTRQQADLYDEHARNSLRDMYSGSGFAHRRLYVRDSMTDEQKQLTVCLEYAQPYMKAMDKLLGIDSIIRHAHAIEQDVTDICKQYSDIDTNLAAAYTMAQVMQAHAEQSVNDAERTVFLSLKRNAELDAQHATQCAGERYEQAQESELTCIEDIDNR